MELKRCEPTQQDGSREEWRRQTLRDKLDNNMVKKKIRQASPSFKKIFPQKARKHWCKAEDRKTRK